MSDELPSGSSLVLDLLNYIEQVEKLKAKPAFSIPKDVPFVAYQHEYIPNNVFLFLIFC